MTDRPSIDHLLSRADRGGGEVRVDHYALRQQGVLPPPSKGRLLRNNRQELAHQKRERDRLARRRTTGT